MSQQAPTVLHLLPNYETGGAQEVLCRMIEAMGDEPYRQVAVGVFGGPQDFRPQYEAVCAATYDINIERAPITRPHLFLRDVRRILSRLVDIAQREGACVVHGQTHDNDLLALLLGRRLGIASVATHHGARLYPDNRMQPSARKWVRTQMLRHVMKRLDAIVAVGPDVRDVLIELAQAPQQRVHLMRNAVAKAERATPERRTERRAALGLPASRRLLLVVGRLIPAKGVDTLIEAIAAMPEEPHHPTLLVVGDGPDRERLESIRRDLQEGVERVHFLGLRSDVPDLLTAADAYLSGSHSEGTSMALLEAMARALPCVVADSPGLRDLIEDGRNGRLFAVKDPADCARVIGELLDDGGQDLAIAAQAEVRTEFSMDALVRQHLDLYDTLRAQISKSTGS